MRMDFLSHSKALSCCFSVTWVEASQCETSGSAEETFSTSLDSKPAHLVLLAQRFQGHREKPAMCAFRDFCRRPAKQICGASGSPDRNKAITLNLKQRSNIVLLRYRASQGETPPGRLTSGPSSASCRQGQSRISSTKSFADFPFGRII